MDAVKSKPKGGMDAANIASTWETVRKDFFDGLRPTVLSVGLIYYSFTGLMCQISSAYCAIVLSELNFPALAMFIQHFFANASVSL